MYNFKVYEWDPDGRQSGAVGWFLFDQARRVFDCHGKVSASFFGSGTYNFAENHPENSDSARVYEYGTVPREQRRKFKFVKELA